MKELFSNVKLLISDVDGVMTSGKIVISDLGHETKIFNVHDGFGITLLLKKQIEFSVITARQSKNVTQRFKALGVKHIFQGAKKKLPIFENLLHTLHLKPHEVAFVGDDWQDLPLLNRVGLPIAVANAVPEVKAKAAYVTKTPGGEGAIREVAMKILRAKGFYKNLLKEYLL